MTEGADPNAEALAALERLVHRYKVITPEQALAAARLITGNPGFEFSAPPAQAQAPAPTDKASPAGSESL